MSGWPSGCPFQSPHFRCVCLGPISYHHCLTFPCVAPSCPAPPREQLSCTQVHTQEHTQRENSSTQCCSEQSCPASMGPSFPSSFIPLVPQSLSLARGQPGIPLQNTLFSFANYSRYSRRAHTQQAGGWGLPEPIPSPSTQEKPLFHTSLCLCPSPTPPLFSQTTALKEQRLSCLLRSLWDQPSGSWPRWAHPWLTVGRVTACPSLYWKERQCLGQAEPPPG